VVPRVVEVGAIAVVFAVGRIALGVVGDQVGEREPVVRGHEVERARRRPQATGEDVGGTRETGGQLAKLSRVAAPELARGIAIVIVPFGPAGRKGTEAVASGPTSQGSAISLSSRSAGSCAIACSSGASGSKPSARRPSVVARSKRKPSTPVVAA
jgi:hypothetical protein